MDEWHTSSLHTDEGLRWSRSPRRRRCVLDWTLKAISDTGRRQGGAVFGGREGREGGFRGDLRTVHLSLSLSFSLSLSSIFPCHCFRFSFSFNRSAPGSIIGLVIHSFYISGVWFSPLQACLPEPPTLPFCPLYLSTAGTDLIMELNYQGDSNWKCSWPDGNGSKSGFVAVLWQIDCKKCKVSQFHSLTFHSGFTDCTLSTHTHTHTLSLEVHNRLLLTVYYCYRLLIFLQGRASRSVWFSKLQWQSCKFSILKVGCVCLSVSVSVSVCVCVCVCVCARNMWQPRTKRILAKALKGWVRCQSAHSHSCIHRG